jgi:protein transport protein SEC13
LFYVLFPQDRLCVIWSQDETGNWKSKELPKFPAPVWRVSWSITGERKLMIFIGRSNNLFYYFSATGNILAVSSGDNRVTLWKEVADGDWKVVSAVTETGVTDQVSS